MEARPSLVAAACCLGSVRKCSAWHICLSLNTFNLQAVGFVDAGTRMWRALLSALWSVWGAPCAGVTSHTRFSLSPGILLSSVLGPAVVGGNAVCPIANAELQHLQ